MIPLPPAAPTAGMVEATFGYVFDLRLAEKLGYDKPRDIRKLIALRKARLEQSDELRSTIAHYRDAKGRQRRGREFWLNRKQALEIAMMVRTPAGARVRFELVTFTSARMHGKPKPPTPLTDGLFALFNGTAPR